MDLIKDEKYMLREIVLVSLGIASTQSCVALSKTTDQNWNSMLQ